MENSKIEWTQHTFNPWWGCSKVSEGCANCYAETFSKRTGHGVWGDRAPRRFFADAHWNEPLKWDAAAEKKGTTERVFCASMADVFERRPDLVETRARLFTLIRKTRNLRWLLLTKRPGDIIPCIREVIAALHSDPLDVADMLDEWLRGNPPRNVWLGSTAENQPRWDERLPLLKAVPAAVHFVSAEPLLGPIDMGPHRPDWLIVGGESGPKARPMQAAWARSLRDQCHGPTAFFFKQWGGVRKHDTGRVLDGRTWDELPWNKPTLDPLAMSIMTTAKGKMRDVKRLRKFGASESEIAKALDIPELDLSMI